MFDIETARLIRSAPRLEGVDPNLLPQRLTEIYAQLVGLRLQGADLSRSPEFLKDLEELRRLATVYEAFVDRLPEGDDRRAAAFVAGTAYQILGRAVLNGEPESRDFLTSISIHPAVAAPLLFLIAEQNPDAREASRNLLGRRTGDLLSDALLETIVDLALEQFGSILGRAERLSGLRASPDMPISSQATLALYGQCWTAIVQIVAHLLNTPTPASSFTRFDTPQEACENVINLAVATIEGIEGGAELVTAYSGPRHLARLIRHVAAGLADAGIATLPAPQGADENIWRSWIQHRAQSKPVLWPNHRKAVATGFLDKGVSGVLVLPTGAGKTTLSELKIAATLAQGKKVFFLVPTLALVDQLRDDLRQSFPQTLGNIGISVDGDLTAIISGPELESIEVMTPERCLALLSYTDADVEDVGLLVFDECHLLTEQGGGKRSVDAMLCLLHMLKRAPQADLLLLSAMLLNGQDVADWLTEVTGRRCEHFLDPWKPSRQARGVVVYSEAEVEPIRLEARRKTRVKAAGQRFAAAAPLTAMPWGLFGLQNNWNPNAPEDRRLILLSEEPVELALGLGGAAPNANKVASILARHAATAGLKTIVFVQKADNAPSTAALMSPNLGGAKRLTDPEEGYWRDIQLELGAASCSLIDPTAGALPHNGDMIAAERRLAESLFRRVEGVDVIVATPTLAQGMNLPAQMAILAGTMRHGDDGREPLKAHEILNAAGRAGRAGYLSNGVVLLIPEPVVTFRDGNQPTPAALDALKAVLPPHDRCVVVTDPLTPILDRIQAGDLDGTAKYLISKLRAGEDDANAAEAAQSLARKSFGAFLAHRQADDLAFEQKVTALRNVLAQDAVEAIADVARVAAFTGMPEAALSAIHAHIELHIANLPTTIEGWVDWLIDFFREDREAFQQFFGDRAEEVTMVARGKKVGGVITDAEFNIFKAGLAAWLAGKPFCEIELALGVLPKNVKTCKRARDLVLKLANRELYMIAAALSELVKASLVAAASENANPAAIEVLAMAIRTGFDLPEKLAYSHLIPGMRVQIHREFGRRFPNHGPTENSDFQGVVQMVKAMIAFGGDDDEFDLV